MGLTPSRGGSLPAPCTHLSSRIRSRDQPGAADKMAAAAFSSGPHRNSTSARPPDRTWSRHTCRSDYALICSPWLQNRQHALRAFKPDSSNVVKK
ncbi:hypothetical protein NDU88_006222 [Pleurodeles waltl]|uniref:Uncharacterized protein n=1 Tax=Pleurodeles waltl TaxID=8319 RepID=A0AAV7LQ41_PLEWA|nr:hypothetical protein NDU88_006222 [Pleurodeles waltl]